MTMMATHENTELMRDHSLGLRRSLRRIVVRKQRPARTRKRMCTERAGPYTADYNYSLSLLLWLSIFITIKSVFSIFLSCQTLIAHFSLSKPKRPLLWNKIRTFSKPRSHNESDPSTSVWMIRDNSTFPQYYSNVWWRIRVSWKLSPGNFCTIAKISGEFAKALKMTFLGLKTIYICIIYTEE